MVLQVVLCLFEGVLCVQENVCFVLDFFECDICMVGYMGCVNDQVYVVKNQGDLVLYLGVFLGDGSLFDFSVFIQGFDVLGIVLGGRFVFGVIWFVLLVLLVVIIWFSFVLVGGSDVLVLCYLVFEGVLVIGILFSGGNVLLDMDSIWVVRFILGGVVVLILFGIVDCVYVDIFVGMLSVVCVIVFLLDLLCYVVQLIGQMMFYCVELMVYYVGINLEIGQLGLCCVCVNSVGVYVVNEEFVEGIESLQLLYGLDSIVNISLGMLLVGNIICLVVVIGVSSNVNVVGVVQWLWVGQVQVGLLVCSLMLLFLSMLVNLLLVFGVGFVSSDRFDGCYCFSYEVLIVLCNCLFGN